MRFVLILLVFIFFIVGIVQATPQISISTSNSTYEYGQNLSFTIEVSKVTNDYASFEIVDNSGQSSSPINVAINKLVSNITAPVPFYKTTFSPGIYYIKLQYSDSNATAKFQIIDTSKIVIPPEFKVVAESWSKGDTSDKLFAAHLQTLIQYGIIRPKNYQEDNMTFIPEWFKNDAKWWANDSISDESFGMATEFLVDYKIMRI